MSVRLPRVCTIAAGAGFLHRLADEVLAGFPVEGDGPPLSAWTILLPTRRATRRFAEVLRAKSGAKALVLPRIRPIGDLDEDRLQDEGMSGDLPPALPPAAQLLALNGLVAQWAKANTHIGFAQEIAASPVQRLGLAKSLNELVITLETQEIDFARLKDAYDVDLSEHRGAILSLLELLSEHLPALHKARGTMGGAARRSAMIRREAQRIAKGGHHGPVIAAGSTGTIPATRSLLGAIARHPQGAIILPGLDQLMDDASWDVLPQEHAQFALKQLLADLGIRRGEVTRLGSVETGRNLLASEMLRPSATAEVWHGKLPGVAGELGRGLAGLSLVEAADRHLEARAIALMLRETLEHPGRTAALVTPDRDLATRVAAELGRWHIDIADSAGRSLAATLRGSAMDLLLEASLAGLTPQSVMAFLHHPLVNLGSDAAALRNLEIAALRGFDLSDDQAGLVGRVALARATHAQNSHAHPLVSALTEADWVAIAALAQRIDELLLPLSSGAASFASWVQAFARILQQACGEAGEGNRDDEALTGFWDELSGLNDAGTTGHYEAALLAQNLLRATPAPPLGQSHPRLEILGTLEARLLPFDLVVLGGLNETVWPAQPDTGAWLNRPMRDKLGLPQPEKDIGLAAHDFEQGFASPQVILTCARRLGGAPAAPSRWLLRLKTVLVAAGLGNSALPAPAWEAWAKSLQAVDGSVPIKVPLSRPKPCPPIAARPTRFSVTDVERLVRDPYAIYARRILKLQPLPEFGLSPDAALRGSLFHDAIAVWNKAQAKDGQSLIEAGRQLFAQLAITPEVRNFWWPQFERIAHWLAEQEQGLKPGLLAIHAEQNGAITFDIGGVEHRLTARADRIDIMEGGRARLIDYKTGAIPSEDQVKTGLSPQLTLEAAILRHGGFAPMAPKSVAEALYLRIGGGREGLKLRPALAAGEDLEGQAETHLAGFKSLLGFYRQPDTSYVPRLRVFKEADETDYDHLSRYLEWRLAGEP